MSRVVPSRAIRTAGGILGALGLGAAFWFRALDIRLKLLTWSAGFGGCFGLAGVSAVLVGVGDWTWARAAYWA